MKTPATLSVLLDGLIDYAGLFPPAKLDMPDMVATYRRVMLDPRGWMVGRVIVPVARLAEFEQAAADLLPDEEEAEPWCLSALTRPCGDDGFAEDLDTIEAFNQRHAEPAAGRAVVDVIEAAGDCAEAIDRALDLMPDTLFPFIEIPLAGDPRGLLAVLAGSEAAAKIRTGGVRPELYPGSGEVARFLVAAAAAGVPFKATAGLHHPFPNDHPVVPARQHGFIGVYTAAAAAHAAEADAETVRRIIEIDDPSAFAFDDASLTVSDLHLTRDDLEEARLGFAISYGSCSIDEPWEDLEAIDWLTPQTETTGS
ncbi:MAG: hypothetical protein QF733_06145 [Phycisphaerales bacterium]|jgi:hypothetical protein|nr:hypothetical protein [Phycisphaerales bacterium]